MISRAYGTSSFNLRHPPVNWRAIVGGPYGTCVRIRHYAELRPCFEIGALSVFGFTPTGRAVCCILSPLRGYEAEIVFSIELPKTDSSLTFDFKRLR